MLHACVQRFDVTRNLEKFCKILRTKQALSATKEDSNTPKIMLVCICMHLSVSERTKQGLRPFFNIILSLNVDHQP